MMYERECKIKKYGNNPDVMGWDKFFSLTEEIVGKLFRADGEEHPVRMAAVCGSVEENGQTLGNHGNAEETREETAEATIEPKAEPLGEGNGTRKKWAAEPEEERQEEKIAPAQKNGETKQEYDSKAEPAIEKRAEPDEGNAVGIMNMPENTYKTRKEYMDTLPADKMAHYLADEYKRMNLKEGMLSNPSQLTQWLLQDVDERGKEIVDI